MNTAISYRIVPNENYNEPVLYQWGIQSRNRGTSSKHYIVKGAVTPTRNTPKFGSGVDPLMPIWLLLEIDCWKQGPSRCTGAASYPIVGSQGTVEGNTIGPQHAN